MKRKNFLIESVYCLGMFAALWFTAHSRAAYAQSKNEGYVYMRGDEIVLVNLDGTETSLLSANRGRILIEADTLSKSLIYRPYASSVIITNLYDDQLHITSSLSIVGVEQNSKIGWITDSIKWVATDTTFEGDCKCEHEWVYGKPEFYTRSSSFGCLVDHNGGHCDFEDDLREKICRKCLFSVIEREKWFQRFVAPPKSEFERLKEKQMEK